MIRAEQAGAPPAPAAAAPPAAAPKKKAPPPPWKEPVLDADTPSPIFGGSTGGLLRKAQVGSARGRGSISESHAYVCYLQ